MLQNIETNEGEMESLGWNRKKLQEKSHSAEKNPSEKHQGGILCFRGSGRRCFCFKRVSGVSSMFWTSVVQVDDVEQRNKKCTDLVELTKKRKSRDFLRKGRLETKQNVTECRKIPTIIPYAQDELLSELSAIFSQYKNFNQFVFETRKALLLN